MKPKLVLACLVPPDVVARARAEFNAVVAEGTADMTPDEIVAAAERHGADAILVTSSQWISADVIARLPASVKIVATSSVGFDHLDVAAARARGLILTNTPEVLTNATADLAFMLILTACRRAHEYDALMRAGWRRRLGQGDMLGVEVSGKTLGILGMGRIGQAVARRARGFGMTVLYHDQRAVPPEHAEGAEYVADFRAMLPRCQILSLHAPGGPATDKIMYAETFALLPKGAVFVNAARGVLVDEDALIAALTSGHLFAAGLDVFRSEPDFDMRFAALPNVFLTPHMGSATVETRNAMGFRAMDNIAAVMAGRPPIDPLWS
jgi:lactate dehydrogenase-like 2-hydroxyacid dehydrogenase